MPKPNYEDKSKLDQPEPAGDIGTPSQDNNGDMNSQQPGDTSSIDNMDDKSSTISPPLPPQVTKGKKRLKCDALKEGTITISDGQIIQIDVDGFFEVEGKEAERLITIPGYEEA